MKNLLFGLSIALVCLLSTGCPVGLEYPLGDVGKEKIDPKLLGTWVSQTADAEMKKLVVTKKDDFTYRVQVLERGEMYAFETDWFDAWATNFDGKTFVFGRPDEENDQKFYHYHYSFEGGKLVTSDMALLDGGVDIVTNQVALRVQVRESMKRPEFYETKVEYVKE